MARRLDKHYIGMGPRKQQEIMLSRLPDLRPTILSQVPRKLRPLLQDTIQANKLVSALKVAQHQDDMTFKKLAGNL